MTHIIRISKMAYKKIIARKGELTLKRGENISICEALDDLLDAIKTPENEKKVKT